MPIVKTEYFHITCSGPAATPFDEHCTTKAPGGWVEEEVKAAAIKAGWQEKGRPWFCPGHADPADALSKVRKAKAEVQSA